MLAIALSCIAVVFFLSPPAIAREIPAAPTDACLRDCTPRMQGIFDAFFAESTPLSLTPAVYSGDCFMKSRDYSPSHAHRAMVLVDRHPSRASDYFATSFAFFGPADGYADWDLARARLESYGAWNHYGPIKIEENTFRVTTSDSAGNPAWIYYARQNPQSKVVYYITRWGVLGDLSFCELHPN